MTTLRKICNHPFLMFWKCSTETPIFVTEEIKDRFNTTEALVDCIFEERNKLGKLIILEKMVKEWKEEGGNKVLIFS